MSPLVPVTTEALVSNPVVGGYGFIAFLHEIGIALGLNDDVQGNDLPAAYDLMAYSVESVPLLCRRRQRMRAGRTQHGDTRSRR